MPIPTFTKLGPNPEFNDIVNKINTLVANLTDLMLSLDSLNVVSLSAGTVIVYDLAGGPGTITLTKDGMVINNGTIDTFTVDINGNVTMTSALVRSAVGFPRVELNSSANLISAYADANNVLDIAPTFGGAPAAVFTAGGTPGVASLGTSTSITTLVSDVILLIQSNGNMNLTSTSGDIRLSPNSNLTINGSAGVSGTVYVSSTSGGPTTTPITFTKGIRTT